MWRGFGVGACVASLFIVPIARAISEQNTLMINLTAPRTVFTPGSEISVHASAKNEGSDIITVNQREEDKLLTGYSIKIFDEAGTQLKPRPDARNCFPDNDKSITPCKGKTIITTVRPGDVVDEDITLSDNYDLSRRGTYKVQVQREVYKVTQGTMAISDGAATSNELVITVK